MELLQNYLPYIVIGLVIFFMFKRGGCCGGHSNTKNHDNHDDHDYNENKDDRDNSRKSCH
ncbi:MAG: hypothetical protein APF84_01065 [Gracilibacter sp. BRH_c7a]|nr:MAG: hypothetical protein APF84_01065 [Gracilibacter sp. BRH_c7a]